MHLRASLPRCLGALDEHCKMILNEYETAPIYRRVGGGESTTLHSPSSKRHGRNRSPGRASSSSIIILARVRGRSAPRRMRLITSESTRKAEGSWRDGS